MKQTKPHGMTCTLKHGIRLQGLSSALVMLNLWMSLKKGNPQTNLFIRDQDPILSK